VLFPGDDPVGRTLVNEGRAVTVIGVARDAKYRSLGERPRNFIYVPLSQRYFERTSLLLKSTEGPGAGALPADVRRLVAVTEPALPVLRQRTLVEQTASSLFPQRIALVISAALGGVALLLGLLGIYGVTAFNVAQRTREIGVRVALGARPFQVALLVLRSGVGLTVAGVAVGAVAAVGATRLLRSLLYGISPADGLAFGAAAGLLVLAAVAASWVPARRATRVDPAVALRSD
jgi:ABC-type antimicrobial peptide transport system permease subunit